MTIKRILSRVPTWAMLAPLASVILLWLVAVLLLRSYDSQIEPASMRFDAGHARIFSIGRPLGWPFVSATGDSNSDPTASRLRLFESGQELGPEHATLEDVRSKGRGAYAHRARELYFSSSDGTDPAANAHIYIVRMPLEATPGGWILALSCLAALTIIGFVRGKQAILRKMRRTALQWLVIAARPPTSAWDLRACLLVGMLLVLGGVAYLGYLWATGRSVSLSLAGFYQISDPGWYWVCANGLLDMGSFPLPTRDWCENRPLYSSLLASFAAITGRRVLGALAIQATVLGLVLALTTREMSRFAGWAGALLAAALLFLFAVGNAFPLTMSENAGLIWGSLALVFLLHGAETASQRLVLVGIVLLSVALNARAGALFMLPLVALWAGAMSWKNGRSFTAAIVWAVMAAIAGFVLQAVLIKFTGGNAARLHGNFSYVLYGLSAGGGTWTRIYTDHPELFKESAGFAHNVTTQIYALAWENIQARPGLLADAIAQNLLGYLSQQFGDIAPTPVLRVARACWWLGLGAYVVRWRDPRYSLLAALSLGGIFSAPLIIQDGGVRIFAASIAYEAAQAAAGLHLLVTLAARLLGGGPSLIPATSVGSTRFARVLTATLAVATLAPLTPLRYVATNAPIAAPKCGDDTITIVARMGRETLQLGLLPGGVPPDPLHMRLGIDVFRAGLDPEWWYSSDFAALEPGTLMLAYQRFYADETRLFSPYPVIWNGDLGPLFGRTVRICVDRRATRSVGGWDYWIGRSLEPLN